MLLGIWIYPTPDIGANFSSHGWEYRYRTFSNRIKNVLSRWSKTSKIGTYLNVTYDICSMYLVSACSILLELLVLPILLIHIVSQFLERDTPGQNIISFVFYKHDHSFIADGISICSFSYCKIFIWCARNYQAYFFRKHALCANILSVASFLVIILPFARMGSG